MRLSYSYIRRFKACPRWGVLSLNHTPPERIPFDALKGKEIHLALEAYYKGSAELLKAAVSKYDIHPVIVKKFQVVAVEQEFYLDEKFLPISSPDKAFVKGIIDLIVKNGNVEIWDHKTHRVITLSDKEDFKNQLLLYALYVVHLYPRKDKIHGVIHLTQEGVLERVFEGVTEKDLQRVKDDVLFTYEQILKAERAPRPTAGAHCSKCEYALSCPAYQNLPVKPPENEEEAKSLASYLAVLQEKVSTIESFLKEFSKSHGWVFTEDGTLQYGYDKEKVRELADIEKFTDLVKKKGIPKAIEEGIISIPYAKLEAKYPDLVKVAGYKSKWKKLKVKK